MSQPATPGFPVPVSPAQSPSKVVQHGVQQSWDGIKGLSQPGNTTPVEALQKDPRKNPVKL
jgi:hypothetical protein